MITDCHRTTVNKPQADEFIALCEQLSGLLEQQLAQVKRGNLSGLESLIDKTEPLVQRISTSGLLDSMQFQAQRQRLRNIYEKLGLIVSADKEQVAAELKRLQKGKRLLAKYRNGI